MNWDGVQFSKVKSDFDLKLKSNLISSIQMRSLRADTIAKAIKNFPSHELHKSWKEILSFPSEPDIIYGLIWLKVCTQGK